MRFATKFAAYKAMVLLAEMRLRNVGASQIEPQSDGSIRFRKLGKYWVYDLARGRFTCEPVPVITIQSQKQDVSLPTSAETFASRGDAWNARNYQHDAGDPHARARRNAFGDLCQKPDIEGYHAQDFDTTMANQRAQMDAQARVRAEENVRRVKDDRERRLAVVRMTYRAGRR